MGEGKVEEQSILLKPDGSVLKADGLCYSEGTREFPNAIASFWHDYALATCE